MKCYLLHYVCIPVRVAHIHAEKCTPVLTFFNHVIIIEVLDEDKDCIGTGWDHGIIRTALFEREVEFGHYNLGHVGTKDD